MKNKYHFLKKNMKTGKFISIKTFDNFSTGYGSVNIKNLKSIYVDISSWVIPKSNDKNWKVFFSDLRRKIIFNLKDRLKKSSFFKCDHIIVNLDIKTNGIETNKKSFLHCEITMFIKKQTSITDIKLKDEITYLTKQVIKDCFKPISFIKYQKSKRT